MSILTPRKLRRESPQINLRRNQDTLIIVGTGVILFGVWSLLKTVFTLLLGMGDLYELIKKEGSSPETRIAAFIFVVLVLMLDLGLRLFVGISAIAVGRGKKSRFIFVGVALVMALSSAGILTAHIRGTVTGDDQITMLAHVSAVVELTSLVTLTQLINSAMAIRGIRRELKKQEKQNAA